MLRIETSYVNAELGIEPSEKARIQRTQELLVVVIERELHGIVCVKPYGKDHLVS